MSLGSCNRGCGKRVPGGIYAEVPLSPFGRPVEDFIFEPPTPIDADALGLSPIGVQLIERDGAFHVLDWIGEENYPNVADMVEEIRNFGLSRRLGKSVDFSKLTAASRILLVHRRAWVENWDDYLRARCQPDVESLWNCPKAPVSHEGRELLAHLTPEEVAAGYAPSMCVGTWYHDLEGGTETAKVGEAEHVERKVGDTIYHGFTTPEGIVPEYKPAIFASFPIINLAVVRDPEGDSHKSAFEAAEKAALPITLETE